MVYMIFLTRVEQGESSIVQFDVNEKNCKKFYEISEFSCRVILNSNSNLFRASNDATVFC